MQDGMDNFAFFFFMLVYCNLAVHKMNWTGLKEKFRLCKLKKEWDFADWAWFKWQILQHLWPLDNMQDMNVHVFWMLSLFSNKYKLRCKFSVNISQLTFTEYAFKTKKVPWHSTEQCSYNKDPCLPSTVFWMSTWQGFFLPCINCEL